MTNILMVEQLFNENFEIFRLILKLVSLKSVNKLFLSMTLLSYASHLHGMLEFCEECLCMILIYLFIC